MTVHRRNVKVQPTSGDSNGQLELLSNPTANQSCGHISAVLHDVLWEIKSGPSLESDQLRKHKSATKIGPDYRLWKQIVW